MFCVKVVEETENADDAGQTWTFLSLGVNNLGDRYRIKINNQFLTGANGELTIEGKKD